MLNPIKKELDRLAHEILAQKADATVNELMEKVHAVYKQLILLDHLQQQSPMVEAQQDVVPVTEKINELVTELPLEEEAAAIEDLFATVANPVFIKKEEEQPPKAISSSPMEQEQPKNLNDVLGKGIHIGLNDRLAFINNLFDSSAEDYQRVISQVQTFASWEEAKTFIDQMIKPDYNNWEGKEDFENRFLKCLESNF
ncbi:MAG: hypothetical protein ACPG8F_04220 [Flavobacteriaceae bacterium]